MEKMIAQFKTQAIKGLGFFICFIYVLAAPAFASTLIYGSLSATLSDDVIPGIGGPTSGNPRNDFRGANVSGTFIVDPGNPTPFGSNSFRFTEYDVTITTASSSVLFTETDVTTAIPVGAESAFSTSGGIVSLLFYQPDDPGAPFSGTGFLQFNLAYGDMISGPTDAAAQFSPPVTLDQPGNAGSTGLGFLSFGPGVPIAFSEAEVTLSTTPPRDDVPPSVIPLPAAAWMLIVGLASLGALRTTALRD
ncbi:MAG: VPLPA-CTERM sorting domain-containing protein [Pseudomonadota bacterium]